MAAILDQLAIRQAAIGGPSVGGYLSLAFALAHPQRVNALILIGARGSGARHRGLAGNRIGQVDEHLRSFLDEISAQS